MSSFTLLRPPSNSNILSNNSRQIIHSFRPKSFLSMEFPQRINMYVQDELRSSKPTLASAKKAKSLASIRLLAATKMRVRSAKSTARPNVYHPTSTEGRYSRDAFVINPQTGSKVLAVNVKSALPSPLQTFLHHGHRLSRPSITSIDQVKKQIQEELRKRQENRRKTPPADIYVPVIGVKHQPRKRVQSGRYPSGLVTGSTLRSQNRAMSARNFNHQVSTGGLIAPWEPNRQDQEYDHNDSIFP